MAPLDPFNLYPLDPLLQPRFVPFVSLAPLADVASFVVLLVKSSRAPALLFVWLPINPSIRGSDGVRSSQQILFANGGLSISPVPTNPRFCLSLLAEAQSVWGTSS